MTPALRVLSDTERFDWLRLIRSDSIGPRTFAGLLGRFGSARAALEALPRLGGRRSFKPAASRDVEAELEAARRAGIRFVASCEPAYPPSLRVIDSAPPLLAVRGRIDILQRSMVAIVGSRNASAVGLVFTERLAQGLGGAGHAVVSGLARGIDAGAHRGSLATGTVGVLAGGHDRIYPSEHVALVERIVETGAIVSEMPLAWEPRGRDFPRRNRIVSGLALGVVVVEAARRSGSLITARFANEQGREVFAVPGSPLDPRAEGTNDLLRQGATLCTSFEDVTDVLLPMTALPGSGMVLRELGDKGAETRAYWDEADVDASRPWLGLLDEVGPVDDETSTTPGVADISVKSKLADFIGSAPIAVDDLVRVSALPAQTVQSLLVELELDGILVRHGTNLLSRAARDGG